MLLSCQLHICREPFIEGIQATHTILISSVCSALSLPRSGNKKLSHCTALHVVLIGEKEQDRKNHLGVVSMTLSLKLQCIPSVRKETATFFSEKLQPGTQEDFNIFLNTTFF